MAKLHGTRVRAERAELDREFILQSWKSLRLQKFTIWQYKMRVNAVFERTRAATKEAFSLTVSIYLYSDYSFKTYT